MADAQGRPNYPVNYLVFFTPQGLVSSVRSTSLVANETYESKKQGGYCKTTWNKEQRMFEDISELPEEVKWLFDHDRGSLVSRIAVGKNFPAENRSDTYSVFSLYLEN